MRLPIALELVVDPLEEGLAVFVVLLVGADGLDVVLGETFYFLLYLPDAQFVVVVYGKVLGILAGLLGLVGVGDVLLALFRALALLFLRFFLLLHAHVFPGLLGKVALGLAVVLAGLGVALFGLPVFLGPLFEVPLGSALLALVATAPLFVLLGEELGLAGAPLSLLATLVGGFDLLFDLLPELWVGVLLLEVLLGHSFLLVRRFCGCVRAIRHANDYRPTSHSPCPLTHGNVSTSGIDPKGAVPVHLSGHSRGRRHHFVSVLTPATPTGLKSRSESPLAQREGQSA